MGRDILRSEEVLALTANTTNEDGGIATEADLVLVLEWARKTKVDFMLLTAVLNGDAVVTWCEGQPHFQRSQTVH